MRKIAVLVVAVAVALTGCGGDDDPTLSAEGNGDSHNHAEGNKACEPSADPVQLSADDNAFDRDCIAVRAGQPFTIAFDNKDIASHNVTVLDRHGGAVRHFVGDLVAGGAKATYQGPALPAGQYHFHCDVHPQMQGDFLVK